MTSLPNPLELLRSVWALGSVNEAAGAFANDFVPAADGIVVLVIVSGCTALNVSLSRWRIRRSVTSQAASASWTVLPL